MSIYPTAESNSVYTRTFLFGEAANSECVGL